MNLHAQTRSRRPHPSNIHRGTARSWLTRLLTVAALFAVALAMPSRGIAQEPLRIRVLSYNIHHGEGVDGKLDLERIARVINDVKPDLVSLQEVERNTSRTGNVDQPAELARLTGFKAVFEKNIDFGGGYYGNAVLSRHPIVASKNHYMPRLDNGEQRGALVVQVEVGPEKLPLIFVATHLDHRRDDRERRQSAELINKLAEEWKVPAILAGDLNAPPESEVLKIFAQQWERANREVMPTIPVAKPRVQIDYILLRSPDKDGAAAPSRWKVRSFQVLDEAVASDHRAVFAELELLPAAKDDGQR